MITFDAIFTGGYQYRVSSDGTYGSNVMCACDSAGGVSVFCKFRNVSGKTIKYVNLIGVTPMNAVDDAVSCTATGRSALDLTITGPIAPGTITGQYQFEHLWYNATITGLSLESIEIIYMDGTTETVEFTLTDKKILADEKFSEELPELIFKIIGWGLLILGFLFLLSLGN